MFYYGLRFICCLSCWVAENIVKFLGHVDYYLLLGYPYVAIIKYVCCRRKSPIVICWIVIVTWCVSIPPCWIDIDKRCI